MRTRLAALAAVAVAAGCGGASAGGRPQSAPPAPAPATTASTPAHASAVAVSWPQFGGGAARLSSIGPIGISAPARLHAQRVSLPGVVDSAPVYAGGKFVMTTTYGRAVAVNAKTGKVAWTFTPASYDGLKGTYRITNASPATDGAFVYSGSPDGRVYKLRLSDGRPVGGRWPVRITKLPEREKLTPSFGIVGTRLMVGTDGYIGDQPPYQGHLVAIDTASGRIAGVTNSLCANRHRIIAPSSCGSTQSAFWSRSGAVRMADNTWLFATGNGPFNGSTDFGDSVIRVSGDARHILGTWTPSNQAQLKAGDTDVGSTGPVLIGGGSILQSGKDGRLHVFGLSALHRHTVGHERQDLPAVGGAMFTAPAVWHEHGQTWVFTTTGGGTAAYKQIGGRLHRRWANGTAGTSPLVAGGLLYVFDPGGSLVVYRANTGRVVARLPASGGHWNSPAPGPGVIALPVGNANDHSTNGTLYLYRR